MLESAPVGIQPSYLSIGEVAKLIDIEVHTIRYWHGRFPQLKPMTRSGGRRFFRPEDIEVLRQIKELIYEQGYTVGGAQRVLGDTEQHRNGKAQESSPAPYLGHEAVSTGAAPAGSKTELNTILARLQEARALLEQSSP